MQSSHPVQILVTSIKRVVPAEDQLLKINKRHLIIMNQGKGIGQEISNVVLELLDAHIAGYQVITEMSAGGDRDLA
jgi:hypothetical protein